MATSLTLFNLGLLGSISRKQCQRERSFSVPITRPTTTELAVLGVLVGCGVFWVAGNLQRLANPKLRIWGIIASGVAFAC